MVELQEKVITCRDVLRLSPSVAVNRDRLLLDLSDALWEVFISSQDEKILEEIITLREEVVSLQPSGHHLRARSLLLLGRALWNSCQHFSTDNVRLHRSIELLREALALCPAWQSPRDDCLCYLANALRTLYRAQRDSNESALVEAISLQREALSMRPNGHPLRLASLISLSITLHTRYEDEGDLDYLAECSVLNREALALTPAGHGHRLTTLNNLAVTLRHRYREYSDLDALTEAIALLREVLELSPPGHPDRHLPLINLADAMLLDGERRSDPDVLGEIIDFLRECVGLLPPTHRLYPMVLENLAAALLRVYEQQGGHHRLAEAIALLRATIELRSRGNIYRHLALDSLAKALLLDFERNGDWLQLESAVALHRQALELRPSGHPERPSSLENLGRAVRAQYDHQPRPELLEEELRLYHEGFNICRERHPKRGRFCFLTSQYFFRAARVSPSFNFMAGVAYLGDTLSNASSPTSERLQSSIAALRLMEQAANTLSAFDAPPRVRQERDLAALDVYVRTIRLLPLAANLGLNNAARLRALAGSDPLSRNAATRAILMRRDADAVEMLEEGRGIFWAQALRLRASGLAGVPADEQEKLQRMFRTLEESSHCVDLPDTTAAQRERQMSERERLGEYIQALLTQLRSRPGLERLLMPLAFSSLMQSLPDGFVIFLVASDLGSHALILQRDGGAKSIALKTPRSKLFSHMARTALPRDAGIATVSAREGIEDTTRLKMVRKSATESVYSFKSLLGELWTAVIRPVLGALDLKKASGRERPRAWWCVTGEFSFMPIHAAGIFSEGQTKDCTSDYVVSSYVPTISALIKARRDWRPVARTDLAGLLVCEPSQGPEFLPNVESEIQSVKGCFMEASATLLNTPGRMSVSELRSLLRATDAHVLHLACHGTQKADPLQSSFQLADGELSIEMIMALNLPHAVLAYLSACQTAKGSHGQPDQSVHLAASMLFCGFRSVIGTMWSMSDADGPEIARAVYKRLFEKDVVDLDDIAYALDEAVAELRGNTPATRWASLVHVGG